MKKDVLRHLRINEKGVAIATAMSVVLILALLGAGLLLLSMREMNISLKSESSNQAFHVAEAGVEYATNKILDGEVLVDFSDTKTFGPGEFKVDVVRAIDYTIPRVTYTITSVGTVEDTQSTETSWLPSLINKVIPVAFAADDQKTLNVEMKQTKPFTEYVFFMDEKQDPDNYNFVSYKKSSTYYHDEVTGSVHANGNVGLGYDLSIYSAKDGLPIFSGVIDKDGDGSIDESVTYVNENGINIVGNNPTFNPPHKKVAEAIFPATNDYTFLEGKAGDDWIFHGDTTITLNGGNVSIDNGSEVSIPQNGIIYINNGDVSVSGTLDGRLTIVSAGGTAGGNIKIVDNVTYQNGVIPSVDANDMLGLIAEKDIMIPSNISSDNIVIDGIMLAKNGSIWYEDWDSNSTMGSGSGMVSKGTLTVNGSLIQKTDFGDVSGTGKGKHFGKSESGFLKRYNYDKRLNYLEPPYFFKSDRSLYEITWRQK